MPDNLPELEFDHTRAKPVYPIPVVKFAVRVLIPHEFPTFIRPEWDDPGTEPQVFFGDYYLILGRNGHGRYGSARIQWEHMHRRIPLDRLVGGIPAMAWVKVLPPIGYAVTQACDVVTMIPTEKLGEFRESRKTIRPGTVVLQQPGGEIQFVRPENLASTYYTDKAASQLGLTSMTPAEFEAFAKEQAMQSLLIHA